MYKMSQNKRFVLAHPYWLSSQVNTLPRANSQTRSKHNKDMHKFSSVYSEHIGCQLRMVHRHTAIGRPRARQW
jgi:hypothetical protein